MTLVAESVAHADAVPGTFRFGPGVLGALSAFRGRCTVVRLASAGNERLGVPRWYTLAEAWAEPGSSDAAQWSRNPVIDVDASDPPELVLATGTPVVVIGADIADLPWQRAVVDAVRSVCDRVLVVDVSAAPACDSRYADVETFGHDRSRGSELLALLCRA